MHRCRVRHIAFAQGIGLRAEYLSARTILVRPEIVAGKAPDASPPRARNPPDRSAQTD